MTHGSKRNKYARDLEDDRYRQRIREVKRKPTPRIEEWDEGENDEG